MVRQSGWSDLFWAAFKQSRNPMVLLDDVRLVVDANSAFLELVGYDRDDLIGEPAYRFVVGGPALTPREWAASLAVGHFTGETEVLCADGSSVEVQWGADTELVTGRRLVLLVALSTSRWGKHFRRSERSRPQPDQLSEREREVARLVGQGHTVPEIADELQVAPDTVRGHVYTAMTKTGVRSRAQLVAKTLGDERVHG